MRLQSYSEQSRAAFWRSLATLGITRVVIAVVLLAYVSLLPGGLRMGGNDLYAETCIAYLALAFGFAALGHYYRHRFLAQLSAQVAVDVAAISVLYLTTGGPASGLAILYLFPLAGMAILAPLLLALLYASLVSLFLLGEAAYQLVVLDGPMQFLQAGLYGAAFFAVVVVANRLAARLIGQEELAAERGVNLAVQLAVNEIVMADMGDGVLVTGADGHVFATNPAARRMLGLGQAGEGFVLASVPSLEPLQQAFRAWREDPDGQRVAFVHIRPQGDAPNGRRAGKGAMAAHLQLRFARADTPGALGDERCVVFLQDVTAIENQAQELKLASMGRLTASIAHEVRNPLSAIGHASALLSEDLSDKSHVRLLRIVLDNVARVNRMVEDILQLSRKVQPNNEPVYLHAFLADLLAEFHETHRMPDGAIELAVPAECAVRFDPQHLREVVTNLLTNAVRYASGAPASIRLFSLGGKGEPAELHVQDDGPTITPEVRAHLFEPFYTTSSKGTGLGLYLARELCMNNHANLDYEYRYESHEPGHGLASGRFVITFGPRTA